MPRALALGLVALSLAWPAGGCAAQSQGGWTDRFEIDPRELRPTGRNPWFILEPRYQLVLERGDTRLVITVLDTTVVVDGVETRIVEERESEGNRLTEISRNFFAIEGRTNAVFYFGEDVDIYRNGVVTSHEGGWRSGLNGARFGLMMPGLPLLGSAFYQEIAPNVAMDRARIASLTDTLRTPAGAFSNLVRVEETTPLEPGVREYKLYAAGIGLVKDGDLVLVRYGPAP